MSIHVVTEFHAKPGRGDDVEKLLLEILGESLTHEGCEVIRILRDQDDADHVAGFTQWTQRRNYENYLTWRTEQGFTDTFEAMLTEPLVIHYYDEVFCSPGVAGKKDAAG
jgi:quinol monooxygenase YgiN